MEREKTELKGEKSLITQTIILSIEVVLEKRRRLAVCQIRTVILSFIEYFTADGSNR